MALKFQYNKTYLQELNKGLKVRVGALPTLLAKESALRLEVKKAREAVAQIEKRLAEEYAGQNETHRLWRELPEGIVSVKEAAIDITKIAGVGIPVLRDVIFEIPRYSVVLEPAWVPQGIETIKRLVRLKIGAQLAKRKVTALEYARRKTTQKVNLYEKVQIPEYEEAIRKIKRFMEDEDNLSKSSQKILKARLAALEAA
jgi:V/A-type H+-transporting ATPase subunit D